MAYNVSTGTSSRIAGTKQYNKGNYSGGNTLKAPVTSDAYKTMQSWPSSASSAASLSALSGSSFGSSFDIQGYLAGLQALTDRNNQWSAAQAQKQMDYQTEASQKAMTFEADQAKLNREWQEYMSNTAHQREVKDLQAAGLNPVLSATGGSGAPVTSGATASGYAGQGAKGDTDTSGAPAMASLLGTLLQSQTALLAQSMSAQNALAVADKYTAATRFSSQLAANSAQRVAGINYQQATDVANINRGTQIAVAQINMQSNLTSANIHSMATQAAASISANATISAAKQHTLASTISSSISAAASRYGTDVSSWTQRQLQAANAELQRDLQSAGFDIDLQLAQSWQNHQLQLQQKGFHNQLLLNAEDAALDTASDVAKSLISSATKKNPIGFGR